MCGLNPRIRYNNKKSKSLSRKNFFWKISKKCLFSTSQLIFSFVLRYLMLQDYENIKNCNFWKMLFFGGLFWTERCFFHGILKKPANFNIQSCS
jgi:hypothetical protein